MNYKNIKIGFIGSMNSMPMNYALKFKEDGFDVKYIVESPRDNILMRPEIHFKSIEYPYPKWIKEIPFKNTLFRLFFNKYYTKKLYNEMKDCDVIFFNHYGHNISSYFDKKIIKIAMFSGADLYEKCNYNRIEKEIKDSDNFVIKYLKKKLLTIDIDRYRKGIRSCQILSYFPVGMDPLGDKFIQEIMGNKPFNYIQKFDMNFKETGLDYVGAIKNKRMVLFAGVRFLIKTNKCNFFEYKGNDLIIKAVAKYYIINKNIEFHLVNKGSKEDIETAKKMCKDLGIEDITIWHDVMPLYDFLELYKKSDVIFDQVGRHLMGGLGIYGLYLGKPVIANARLDVFENIWGRDIPILNATSVDEILNHLIDCKSYEYREKIGKKSHKFAKKNIDSEKTYKQYKSAILDLYSKKKS
jgi:hypothetical protein